MLNWSKYFDKIYCINFIQYTKRKNLVQDELKRVGILDSGIFEWMFTYGNDSNKFIQNWIYTHFKTFQQYPNVNVSLMLGHYNCMRDALYNGYEKVLILEDDVRFLKDLNKVQEIIQHRPEDYDIILYDKMVLNVPLSFQFEPINDYFDSFLNCWSASCYQLNRKGMTRLMQLIQTIPSAIDLYFQDTHCHLPDHKICCAHTNMAIQTIFDDADNVKNLFQNIKNYHNHFKILNIDINQYMVLPNGEPLQYGDYIDSGKTGKIYDQYFKVTKDGQKFNSFIIPPKDEINILFNIEEDEFLRLFLFLFSIGDYSKSKFNIFILIDTDNISYYQETLSNIKNSNFKNLNINIFSTKTFINDRHYVNLILPSLFSDFDKILYLDCNFLVKNRGIEYLYNVDLSNCYLAACRDYSINNYNAVFSQSDVKESIIFKYLSNFYFSNKVMLFNLKKIREDGIDKKMEEILAFLPTSKNNKQLENVYLNIKQNSFESQYFPQNELLLNYYDQSLLNFIFRENVLQINPIFNNNICSKNDLDLNVIDLNTDWDISDNYEYDSKSILVNFSKQYESYFTDLSKKFILNNRQQYLFQYFDHVVKDVFFEKKLGVKYQKPDFDNVNPNILYLTKNKSQYVDITKPIEPTTMNIFLAVDVKNIDKMYPILYSLLKYSQSKFNIYIMLDQENVQPYCQLFKMYQTERMNITLIDNKLLTQCLNNEYICHFNVLSFARFLIPILFPDLDRMLYLDWDTIIYNKGIEYLYNMDFEDKYLIACQDLIEKYNVIENDLEYIFMPIFYMLQFEIFKQLSNEYVNDGILLFNNKKIREEHKDELIVEILQRTIFTSENFQLLNNIHLKHKDLFIKGQKLYFQSGCKSLINLVFSNNILQTNPIFNSTDINNVSNKRYPEIFKNKILNEWKIKEEDYIDKVIIAHYGGNIKPWNKTLKEYDFYSIYQKQMIFKYLDIIKEMKND